jgi:peptide/nickel transport system permease protein
MSHATRVDAVVSEAVGGTEPTAADTAAPTSPWRRLVRDPVVVVAILFVLAISLAALFAPVLAPYDPLKNDLSMALRGPSLDHLLGTDDLGRDVVSRLLYGARISIGASLLAVAVGVVLGAPLGLFVGYRGGRAETIAMRIGDAMIALPGLIVILAVLAVFGNKLTVAMTALGVLLAPTFLRLTRGVAQAIRTEPYIDAARVLGLPNGRILRRHVLPHVLPAFVVHTSLMLGVALLIEAGLSFVGLGTQPPHASLGGMLSRAGSSIRQQPFVIFPPGLAITLTVLALNVVGDGLRDALGRVEPVKRRPSRPPTVSVVVHDDRGADVVERPVLSIRHLTVGFPIGGHMTPVVDDVSLVVGRGEAVGLVGESGCGKTVTALAAIGLIDRPGQVLGGSIEVAGRELIGLSDRECRRLRGDVVAMVFQDPSSSLDPAFTVGDQIGESLRIHRGLSRRAAMSAAAELLERVGISEASRRVRAYPHEFSGGMAQRVAIASALACDPDVLIADEPTTALDVTVQAEILDLLRQLQDERDMGILFVTHDLGVVADLCQRAVVMYAGQVVEEASITALFSAPQHPYTQALLEAIPRSEHRGQRLPTIAGTVPQPGRWAHGCRFAARCSHVTPGCLVAPIAERHIDVGRRARCIMVDDCGVMSS